MTQPDDGMRGHTLDMLYASFTQGEIDKETFERLRRAVEKTRGEQPDTLVSNTPRPARNRLTIEQAADRLGIPDENFEMFERLVDLLRAPEARDAEVARLRAELDDINEVLVTEGFQHPVGLGGVKDMAALIRDLRERDQDHD